MLENRLYTLLLTIINSIMLLSCAEKEKKELIIIGHVKNIPTKKIYITDAYNWKIFIDSANYENDTFQFTLDTSKFPEPFLASICIKNYSDKIEQLGIINYKKTTPNDTFANTGFMLSWGKIEINGDYNNKHHNLFIKPTNENNLLFNSKTSDFASKKNIVKIKEIVMKNPSSYFLLNQLYNYKYLYSSSEIKEILAFFNNELQNSNTGLTLIQYASFLIEKNLPVPNPALTNSKNEEALLFNKSAKAYMLIFWASWCGPCRMEIPQLKAIQNKFPDSILSMKSISIDENMNNWLLALKKENMGWEQYLIPYADLLKIKAQFSINSIPATIFLDSNRREIKRFIGFNEKNIDDYNDFISQKIIKDNLN